MNRAEIERNPAAREIFRLLETYESSDRYAHSILKHFKDRQEGIRIVNKGRTDGLSLSVLSGETGLKKTYSADIGTMLSYRLRLAAFADFPKVVQHLSDSSFIFNRGGTTHDHGINRDGSVEFALYTHRKYTRKEKPIHPLDYDIGELVYLYAGGSGLNPEFSIGAPAESKSKFSHKVDVAQEDGTKVSLEVLGYSDVKGVRQITANYSKNIPTYYGSETIGKYTALYEGEQDELMLGWEPIVISETPHFNPNEFTFPDIRMSYGMVDVSMNLPKGHGLREDTIVFHVPDKIVEPLPVGNLESALTRLL